MTLSKIRIFIFSLYFLFNWLFCNAQDQKSQNCPVIDARLHLGYVVQNWITDSFPKRKIASFYEINFARQTLGRKYWQKQYNYPQTGISLVYATFGNQRQLGWAIGFIPNITFNTIIDKKWNLKLYLGLGLAKFNKPFDSVTNPHNILIGSSITNLSAAQLSIQRNINDHLDLIVGISTFHSSNGHYQVPNVGLNAPCVNFGLKYFPQKKVFRLNQDSVNVQKQLVRLNFKVGLGIHEFAETTGPIGGPKYKVYTGMIYLSRIFGKFSNVHAGLSGKYYTDYYSFIIKDTIFTNQIKQKSSVFGFFLGHEFMMGRFSFLTQGALDLYYPFYKPYNQIISKKAGFSLFVERWFSTRLGVQYYLTDILVKTKNNLFVGFYVNANFGEADFIETGIGYRF